MLSIFVPALQVLLITEQTGRTDGSLDSVTTVERVNDGEKGSVSKLHLGHRMQLNRGVVYLFKQEGSGASSDIQQQAHSTLFSRQILFYSSHTACMYLVKDEMDKNDSLTV